MLKLESLSIFEFQSKFKSAEDCQQYLYELKWPANTFTCRKCKHNRACKGSKPYMRHCTKCHTNESVTAGTLFHRCKFDLLKAFYIVYFVSTTKGGISALELSRKLDLRAKTAWLFKRKVMVAMKSSEQHPMEGDVEVDEFFVGGKDDKVKGRKQGKKKLVAVAIEKKGKGASRIYAKVVESASKEQLWPFIAAHVSKDAHIKTDKWAAYKGLKKEYPNHTQELSNNGSNFDTLHRCIMMIKAWLRGVHHSVQDLQAYLDEYTFRYNRNRMQLGQFENLMARMVSGNPTPYSQIKLSD